MAIVYLLLISSSCLLQWSGAFTPVVYNSKVLPSSQCDQSDPFEDDDQQLMEALKMAQQQLPPPECNPPTTCSDVLRCNSSATSDYYQIQAANGSAVQVYCDTEGTNCGGEGGWMRVAYFNVTDPLMTDPSRQCPVGFRLDTINNHIACIRNSTTTSGCGHISTETLGFTYSRVCGYVRGYMRIFGFAFRPLYLNVPLSGDYVTGVSITYGTPPTHIWTYATAADRPATNSNTGNLIYDSKCPCSTTPGTSPPLYVGNDYYCESASRFEHRPDPLWDGLQCAADEEPCCNRTGLPWFIKNTPTPTAASIDVRVCYTGITAFQQVGVEQLELYIK